MFRRGPEEGQVTLLARGQPHQNGQSRKGKEVDRGNGPSVTEPRGSNHSATTHQRLVDFESDTIDGMTQYAEWDDRVGRPLSPIRDLSDTLRNSMETIHPSSSPEPHPAHAMTLDIVRIPASQLRFFPKVRKPPDRTPRTSLDRDLRRTSLTQQRQTRLTEDGPSIQNDLMTLPRPLRPDSPPKPKPSKSHTVRLRPPTAGPSITTNTLADKLSQFFVVAPPPPQPAWGTAVSSGLVKPRRSMDSATSSNAARSNAQSKQKAGTRPEVLLEMTPRSSPDPPRTAVHSRRNSKKLD